MEDLLKKWKASPYYRGALSSFYHVNPKTLLPEFENEDEVSFIPMEAVDDKDGRIYLQESTFGQVRKGYTVFKENDLLWAKITPCMQNGKSSVAYGLKNGVGFGSTEFHVLRVKDKNVSIEFLWNILRLDSFLKAAQGAFGGSAGQQRVLFLREATGNCRRLRRFLLSLFVFVDFTIIPKTAVARDTRIFCDVFNLFRSET